MGQPIKSERINDPHRRAWYDLCRSLTSEQTAVLLEGISRRQREARADQTRRIVALWEEWDRGNVHPSLDFPEAVKREFGGPR